MKIKMMAASALLAALIVVPVCVHADALSIVNGGFETGSIGDGSISPGITGWTDAGASDGFWLADDNVPGSTPDPTEPSEGSMFLYANRLSGGAGSQPGSSTLSQVVNLSSANLALVQAGGATLTLSFDYFDSDSNDPAEITVTFLDASTNSVGSATTGTLWQYANGTVYNASTAPWISTNLVSGTIDTSCTMVQIDINTGPRAGGSATNLAFDNFSGNVIPEPATIGLVGVFGAAVLFVRRRFML